MLRWNNFDAPLTRDEGEYIYAAQLIKSGRLPYEHSFLQKPPMVAYTYAVADSFAPGVFWSPRILAGVFVAITTLLLGHVARKEFGSGDGDDVAHHFHGHGINSWNSGARWGGPSN